MRSSSLTTRAGTADLVAYDRLFPRYPPHNFKEAMAIAKTFKINQDNLGVRIAAEIINAIDHSHVALVTNGDNLTELDTTLIGQVDERTATAAGLGNDRNTPT